jgi:hypothetical protein
MQVHNDQDCVLVIGDVRIKGGESKPIPVEWETRVQQLADAKALRIHGGLKVEHDDRPSRGMSPAELFAAMSEDDRKAAIASVMGERDSAPAITEHLKSEYRKAADSMAEPTEPPAKPVPEGAPADFATCHHNKALAFVRKCSDADLLTRLGNDENRESVLAAIIDRINTLKPSN